MDHLDNLLQVNQNFNDNVEVYVEYLRDLMEKRVNYEVVELTKNFFNSIQMYLNFDPNYYKIHLTQVFQSF